MIISVYGAGYVGLVSAVCLAKLGHSIICADVNEQRIAMLKAGGCPIFEQKLPALLAEQLASRRLYFTTDLSFASKEATVHIIATGTPSLEDGKADLAQVFAVVNHIIHAAEKAGVVVIKSTVPVGTGDLIQEQLGRELAASGKYFKLWVASNPEFLREGSAVDDFLRADRIVIGGEEKALTVLESIYKPLIQKKIPLLKMTRRSAELTKYTANALLACKISFMNQISLLADKLGADIDEIRAGISLDHRIGPHFLEAGIGYGGSCFPKDVRALVHLAKSNDLNPSLLQAIEEINQLQKKWIVERLAQHFDKKLSGLTFGIWGLSFKPGTDDLREASSLTAIETLLGAGVKLRIFDPVAMPVARKLINNESVNWCNSAAKVFDQDIDALVIATEWPEFKNYQLGLLKKQLKGAPVIDGRNCFTLEAVAAFHLSHYYSVGRPTIHSSID